ncbi:MAG: ribonuclease HII [Pseudomonadota bacterium]
MSKSAPDFSFERRAHDDGARMVVGVDEVGRGPIAGPVTAAAVWLDGRDIPSGLNDSKRLGRKRRDILFAALSRCAKISVAHCSVEEIEAWNIRRAALTAMRRAVQGLDPTPDLVLIDGRDIPPDLSCPGQAIVGGDAKSLSIAAASIVAKVVRDRLMVDLAQQYPGYGWEKNAGYPTKSHVSALSSLGVTPYHRRTFRPVHNILMQAYS